MDRAIPRNKATWTGAPVGVAEVEPRGLSSPHLVGIVSVMAIQVRRTEHAGAKNRCGFWGTRASAKAGSRKVRRVLDGQAATAGLADVDRDEPES